MKYKYAHNHEKQIVVITNASKYDDYTCIECEEKMIPRLGLKRIHHFSHYADTGAVTNKPSCSPEHYIHKLAKTLFLRAYALNTPFLLKQNIHIKCINENAKIDCYKQEPISTDLTEDYPLIEVEKKDGDFIPDVLLANSLGEKIYIEFVFTHSSSKKKVKSGHKIIEIDLTTEKDIENIIRHRLIDASMNNIHLYGFEQKSFNCNNDCIKHVIPEDKSRNQNKNNYISHMINRTIESHYYNGDFKFLLKKISSKTRVDSNLEKYRNYIPSLVEVNYEIYFMNNFIGSAQSQEGAIEVANKYVENHTPPSLF